MKYGRKKDKEEIMSDRIELVQGEDRTLYLGVSEENGSPLDMTDCTEIQVWLKNTDGTYLELTYTDDEIGFTADPSRGEIYLYLTAAQTTALLKCNHADFQGDITLADGTVRRIIWEGLLTVIEARGS
jgi:hypothetical protein